MQKIDYILLRRPYRKTISIEVTSKNKVVVKTSKGYPDKLINQFVSNKSKWIQKQLDFNKKTRKPPLKRSYNPGENYLYLGNYYKLLLLEGKPSVYLRGQDLLFSGPRRYLLSKQCIKKKLKAWYRFQAHKMILERVSFFEKVFRVSVSDLKIKDFRRSWGNCSSKGQVSFSLYLIMAPIAVIDYVVAHELAHLIVPNHSDKFWKLLQNFIPDYKQRKKWLVVYENQFSL